MAEERHRRPDRQLALDLDCEGVHRDRAHDWARLSADAHLGAREVAAEAVRVADRHEADPRRPLHDEAAAVAGALPGLQLLHLREVAAPLQHRLEPVDSRIVHERGEAVEGDPATGCVEVSLRNTQRRRAVRDVTHELAAVGAHELREPHDLLVRERGVRVGSREMAHQADDIARRLHELREPVAAHPRVELDVDADTLGNFRIGDGELDVRVASVGDLAARVERTHAEDPRSRELLPQLERLRHRRHAQRPRAREAHHRRPSRSPPTYCS